MQKLISTTEAEKEIKKWMLARWEKGLNSEMVSLVTGGTGSQSIPAQGRILAKPILSDRPIPPFDRVMMDGIAIDSADDHGIGTEYIVEGIQAAGEKKRIKKAPNGCLEVMTGAVMPEGCDCVIPVEELSRSGNSIILSPDAVVESGHFVHFTGSDREAGEELVPSGALLGVGELTAAASHGYMEIEVYTQPKVHIITTGDEAVPIEESPELHQIRRSHATTLTALFHTSANVTTQHVVDSEELTRSAIESVPDDIDVLILTGGISMGKYDFVGKVMRELRGEPVFHGVGQRPGKPLAFWSGEGRFPVFALPGNPVSVTATATRYVLPLLKTMSGESNNHEQAHMNFKQPQSIPLAHDMSWSRPLVGLLPAKIVNGSAIIRKPHNSGDYLCLSDAHGFIELPAQSGDIPAGAVFDFYSF